MFQIEVGFIILLFSFVSNVVSKKTSTKNVKVAAWQRMEHILPLVAEALGPITDLGQSLSNQKPTLGPSDAFVNIGSKLDIWTIRTSS